MGQNHDSAAPDLVGVGGLVRPRAVVLVLHGGQENSERPATAKQLAVLRMIPIARHLTSVSADHALAVLRLRFRYRGWNGDAAQPMADLAWALQRVRLRYGHVPVAVVGHSMGGRAALRGAALDGVVGVVGLAPWVPAGEPIEQMIGRRVLVVHGVRDRVTSPQLSRSWLHAVRPRAEEAIYVSLHGCGHAMLRRTQVWNSLTSDYVLHATLGLPLREPLAQALALGEVSI